MQHTLRMQLPARQPSAPTPRAQGAGPPKGPAPGANSHRKFPRTLDRHSLLLGQVLATFLRTKGCCTPPQAHPQGLHRYVVSPRPPPPARSSFGLAPAHESYTGELHGYVISRQAPPATGLHSWATWLCNATQEKGPPAIKAEGPIRHWPPPKRSAPFPPSIFGQFGTGRHHRPTHYPSGITGRACSNSSGNAYPCFPIRFTKSSR